MENESGVIEDFRDSGDQTDSSRRLFEEASGAGQINEPMSATADSLPEMELYDSSEEAATSAGGETTDVPTAEATPPDETTPDEAKPNETPDPLSDEPAEPKSSKQEPQNDGKKPQQLDTDDMPSVTQSDSNPPRKGDQPSKPPEEPPAEPPLEPPTDEEYEIRSADPPEDSDPGANGDDQGPDKPTDLNESGDRNHYHGPDDGNGGLAEEGDAERKSSDADDPNEFPSENQTPQPAHLPQDNSYSWSSNLQYA